MLAVPRAALGELWVTLMDREAGGYSGPAKLFPHRQQFTEHGGRGDGGVVNANASSKSFRRGSGNTEGQVELVTQENR